MLKDLSGKQKKQIFGWILYDFANTSYSVIIVTVVFAIYFKQYICSDSIITIFGFKRHMGDFLWGLSGSTAMFLVAVSSPYMGALADIRRNKKILVAIYTGITITIMFSLTFIQPGMVFTASILFIISNVGFEGGIVFYNSYLPSLVKEKYWGRLSGWGFGFGYVGSLASLLIALPIALRSMERNDLSIMRFAFPLAALFFLVFSIPFFIWVKDQRPVVAQIASRSQHIKMAYSRIISTFKNLRKYPALLMFLASYFLYIDGVNTVIYFGGIYAKDTLNFTMVNIIIFFAVIQSSAILGSFLFGYIADIIGAKKSILMINLIWILVCVLAFLSNSKTLFYGVGLLAGLGTGSIQATSRTLMTQLIPVERETEFFGFYALCGKFSSILGPLTFGIISSFSGSQRLAILSLIFFFVAGTLLLLKVKISGKTVS